MKWFEGGISEAINESKLKKAVFVVFVYGNDDASKNTLSAINSTEVSAKLESNGFVAIKLESGSEPYHQFVQIYQLVPVPSLFFIGQSGVPLDVVPGQTNAEELLERISKINGTSTQTTEAGSSNHKTEATPTNGPAAAREATPPATATGAIPKEPTPPPQASPETQEESVVQENDLQQRIERAEKARLALLAKRQKEEDEREREREMARRREGQEVAKAKRMKEELEAKQALDERRREREQDQEARERVRQQIAQDKLERAAKFGGDKSSPPPPNVQTSTPAPSSSSAVPASLARLQFRLPDGSSHTNVFSPSDTLGRVREFVRSTLRQGNFSLSMAFPRAELASTDDACTLQDLGLVPSAALLVLPLSSPGPVSNYSDGIMRMFWAMFDSVFYVWSFLRERIWGRPNPPPQSGPGGTTSNPSGRTNTNPGHLRQRGLAAQNVRQEGNVHRLHNPTDSDDDQNTYNGNSTQQM